MKNTTYFPFERNNYFYGKLLSVDDFRLEQKYGNDKRRMLNRFLHGTGVVTGMNVVGVDDTTILVESGLALDSTGREIVIDEPMVRGLTMLDGFSDYEEDRNTNYLYLCVAYEENETEQVHSISSSGNQGGTDFNKIREGYRLFLTRSEPEAEILSSRGLFEETQTVYWGRGIRIRQTLPRFARGRDKAELRIEVENMGQQDNIAFSYELDLACLSYEGRTQMTVSFDEILFDKAGRYTFTYELETLGVTDTRGTLSMVPDSFRLRVGKNQLEEKADVKSSLYISGRDPKEEVRRWYYEKGMDQTLKDAGSQDLYLAKITLLRAGDSVVIDRIEKMPFGQYVSGGYLEDALERMLERGGSEQTASGEASEKRGASRADSYGIHIAQGIEEIELGTGSPKGKKLFSREISHGLGMGNTAVILSLEGEDSKDAYFGAPGIFPEDVPKVELAARTDAQKGTFVIGVQVLAATPKERLRIHWTAVKDRRELLEEKKERRIFIRPGVLNLNTRESYYLEAVCSNMADTEVLWQVKDGGGTIDANGMYTAPNTAGVYEVTASSAADPEIKASIFVIVREKGV